MNWLVNEHTVTERVVGLETFRIYQELGPGIAKDTLLLEIEEDWLTAKMLFMLECRVYKDTHGNSSQTLTFHSPKTWWQHFKLQVMNDSWWGDWFVSRNPVEWEIEHQTVEWECASLFPEASFYPSELGRRVKWVEAQHRRGGGPGEGSAGSDR